MCAAAAAADDDDDDGGGGGGGVFQLIVSFHYSIEGGCWKCFPPARINSSHMCQTFCALQFKARQANRRQVISDSFHLK
jgi:hypothetical protein